MYESELAIYVVSFMFNAIRYAQHTFTYLTLNYSLELCHLNSGANLFSFLIEKIL